MDKEVLMDQLFNGNSSLGELFIQKKKRFDRKLKTKSVCFLFFFQVVPLKPVVCLISVFDFWLMKQTKKITQYFH